MSVGGLKTILVKEGMQNEFESLFSALSKEMKDHESGCILYSLLKSKTDPRHYIVHEQYKDKAALEAHENSEHGKEYFPKIRAILDDINVEYFDIVVP